MSQSFDKALALSQAPNVDLIGSPNRKAAMKAFEDLAKQGGIYGALASFHQAGLLARYDKVAAIKIYDALSHHNALSLPLRHLAQINSAYLLIGDISYQEMDNRLRAVMDEDDALSLSAREILALSAMGEKKTATAISLLEEILARQAPPTLAARARILLDRLFTLNPQIKPRGGSPSQNGSPSQ